MTMITTESRRADRVNVCVDIDVETVLVRKTGTITDLSETGAKIKGQPFAVGERLKLTAGNEVCWATCRWAEQDRMGVQFDTPMPQQLRNLLSNRTPANDRAARPVFGRKATA